MSETLKLLPCPFCGGDGKMGYVRDGQRVHCRLCFASGPSAFHGRPEDQPAQDRAIAAWNTRSDTKQQESYGIPDFP